MRCCRRCTAIFSIQQTSCFVKVQESGCVSSSLRVCVSASLLPSLITHKDRYRVNTIFINLNHICRFFFFALPNSMAFVTLTYNMAIISIQYIRIEAQYSPKVRVMNYHWSLPQLLLLSFCPAAHVTLHYSLGYPLPLVMDKGTA